MVFHGFQKMTMLDFPGYVACTVFTSGCNFRCPFCHNALLVTDITDDEVYTENDILSYLEKRKGVIEGICISGGEPLLHDGIYDFIKKVKATGMLVKLDTNGTFPDRLEKLINDELVDYVAMDIKNSPDKYTLTAGVSSVDIDNVRKSVDILLRGDVGYEFRTTVVKELHTPEDMIEIGKFIQNADKYYIQHFIDSDRNICRGFTSLTREEMDNFKETVRQYVKIAELRGV